MRTNVARRAPSIFTHEGARAHPASLEPMNALRRSVLSCLLWEKNFYEDGLTIADRIAENAAKVRLASLLQLAVEARSRFHLRHVPLYLLALAVGRQDAKGNGLLADTVPKVVQRADELGELMALRMKITGLPLKKTLTNGLRRGLAEAFRSFDEYQLAKYDRDGDVRLRDVMFLVHPKPTSAEQAEMWDRLADRKRGLATPDTWEVALSGGADKKATFERLIRENKLGYLALLRNLRNMVEAGCDLDLVRAAIVARKGAHRVLPFRFVAAARACPRLEPELDQALLATLEDAPELTGETIVLVDVSGSMRRRSSAKSDMERIDVAATLASIVRGKKRVFTFTKTVREVAPRMGMAGVDAIRQTDSGGTLLGRAVAAMNAIPHDRLIVITDEQSADTVPDPSARRAYMINVAQHQNGVGYGKWVHIDGFSEAVLRFIHEHEREDA